MIREKKIIYIFQQANQNSFSGVNESFQWTNRAYENKHLPYIVFILNSLRRKLKQERKPKKSRFTHHHYQFAPLPINQPSPLPLPSSFTLYYSPTDPPSPTGR